MLTKAQQGKISNDLEKGHEIYLKVNTGRYKGSICKLSNIRYIPVWHWRYDSNKQKHKYLLTAQGLIRNLSLDPRDLSETDEGETHLTAKPVIKVPQVLPRDFSNTPIDVGDYVFGQGKLIKVLKILPNNYVQTRCIKSTVKSQEDMIRVHRSLKTYIKIEDATQILLRI